MKQKNLWFYGLPVVGTALLLLYVRAASCNVVYTDYIRLVNTYLPDVFDPSRFFVPDVLTRIPIHYLGRIINVTLFDYNTMFDLVLGVLSLGLSGLALTAWCRERNLSGVWFFFAMMILFGLNQWEMLTNGTGWGHFLAFAGFYYHYTVFDRVLYGRERPHDRVRLLALPFLITLGMAGPYCAVYTAVMLLFYGGAFLLARHQRETEWMKLWAGSLLCLLIPFVLYLWSNSYAVEDHAGAVDITLFEAMSQAFGFFPRFLLKSLASAVVGGETLQQWMKDGVMTNGWVYLLGALLAVGYLFALYLNWKYRLYRETILPLLLLAAGAGNHAIVLLSRFIFLKENYGMSSRYALQYQVGILGMVLTIGLLWKRIDCIICRCVSVGLCVLLLAGHGYTDYVEIKKAPYREEYVENIAAVALQFEEVSDEVLRETFDYRKQEADSGAKVRQALTILKENGWNVFSR